MRGQRSLVIFFHRESVISAVEDDSNGIRLLPTTAASLRPCHVTFNGLIQLIIPKCISLSTCRLIASTYKIMCF